MATPLIVLDTNIFIEHLRRKDKSETTLVKLASQYTLSTTSVSVYELFAGAVTSKHERDVNEILFGIEVYPLDKRAAEIAAKERLRLLKANKQFEIKDILIGGIVLAQDRPLATLNKKHFLFFSNIEILDL